LLVASLENEGVERIFAVPGEENLDILESLRNSKIELIITRHEQAASFMAATYGRFTGKAGVVSKHFGTRSAELLYRRCIRVAWSYAAGAHQRSERYLRQKQGRFQIVDVVSSMTPLTKMARQIVSTATIPAIVREAFRVAQQERPGPVHLELPEDIAGEHAPDLPCIPPHPIELPAANPVALDRAAGLILGADRPLIMLGAAASRPRLTDALSDFIRRVACSVLHNPNGQRRRGWRNQSLHRNSRALRTRLRSSSR